MPKIFSQPKFYDKKTISLHFYTIYANFLTRGYRLRSKKLQKLQKIQVFVAEGKLLKPWLGNDQIFKQKN